jgi:hypothetical protein
MLLVVPLDIAGNSRRLIWWETLSTFLLALKNQAILTKNDWDVREEEDEVHKVPLAREYGSHFVWLGITLSFQVSLQSYDDALAFLKGASVS